MATPDPIRRFVEATNEGDTEAFLDTFADDAFLSDWGRSFQDRAQIARWNQSDNIGVKSHLSIVSISPAESTYRVRIAVTGNGFNDGAGRRQLLRRFTDITGDQQLRGGGRIPGRRSLRGELCYGEARQARHNDGHRHALASDTRGVEDADRHAGALPRHDADGEPVHKSPGQSDADADQHQRCHQRDGDRWCQAQPDEADGGDEQARACRATGIWSLAIGAAARRAKTAAARIGTEARQSRMLLATSRATLGPTSSTIRKRADCSAMTKEMSTFRAAAAMMATLSMPPGLVAR